MNYYYKCYQCNEVIKMPDEPLPALTNCDFCGKWLREIPEIEYNDHVERAAQSLRGDPGAQLFIDC